MLLALVAFLNRQLLTKVKSSSLIKKNLVYHESRNTRIGVGFKN